MTLRAEDFTGNGFWAKGNKQKAELFVEQMNEGVAKRNYAQYQDGFQALIREMQGDLPQLQKSTNRKLFLLDTVARFMEEIQIQEPGYREFPFENRIGIGQLFLNPTLEVRVRDTKEIIGVFESIEGYRLVKDKSKLEKMQDGFIKGQFRRTDLKARIGRAKALLDDPILIFQPGYNDFLTHKVSDKGFFKASFAYILRRKHLEFYSTPEGEAVLKNEVKAMEKELMDIQERLGSYQDEVKILDLQEKETELYREAFGRLMNQYQVPKAKAFN